MVRAILFDVGDTLLDFSPMKTSVVVAEGARNAYGKLKAHGCKIPSLGRYRRGNVMAVRMGLVWSRLRGREMSILRVMRNRDKRLGAPDTDEFMNELGWEWYRPVVEYSTIEPDVISTLRQFTDAGIKLGVVSNTLIGGPLLDRHLKLMGLFEFFPVRVYSCEVGYRKPNPIIFREAINAIGERPEDILFVGDLLDKDVIGARRMGMRTAWRQVRSHEKTHPIADYVIRRISELLPIALPDAAAAPRQSSLARIGIDASDQQAMLAKQAG